MSWHAPTPPHPVQLQDMEGHLRREAHTEMVSQLMTRLGELEDSLEMVQSGAVKAAQLFADREQLRMNDRSYIKNKLQTLKKHAEEVIEVSIKGVFMCHMVQGCNGMWLGSTGAEAWEAKQGRCCRFENASTYVMLS